MIMDTFIVNINTFFVHVSRTFASEVSRALLFWWH
jgi:hypothetical protein